MFVLLLLLFFSVFVRAVDWTAVHFGHTTVIGRPMDRGDALGVDIAVLEHGVHHEGLDGGRGEVQSEKERRLNAARDIHHADYYYPRDYRCSVNFYFPFSLCRVVIIIT